MRPSNCQSLSCLSKLSKEQNFEVLNSFMTIDIEKYLASRDARSQLSKYVLGTHANSTSLSTARTQ